jgi:hypothetical protein
LCLFSCNADPLLVESAERNGITLKSYTPHWRGHVDGKLREGVKFLSAQPEPYAMFVDGYDSLILKPEAEILARLAALGSPLLIAAERTCWPDEEVADQYPDVPAPRFLNSGGYIGTRAEMLTAMHTAILWASGEDDQRAWTRAYLGGALNIQIDHGRRIFQSMGDGVVLGDVCVGHWNGRVSGRKEFWEALCSG